MPDGFLRKEDFPDDSMVSDRTWFLTALCVVLGGWFGLQRLYLGRYGSGAFRLGLLLGAVYCGCQIELGENGLPVRTGLFALVGAVADLLMIAVTPALLRRRAIASSIFPHSMLLSRYPVLPMTGRTLTVPALLPVLVYVYFTAWNVPPGARLLSIGFIAFSFLIGVYWMRDCLRLFYWRNLTDGRGRLPL